MIFSAITKRKLTSAFKLAIEDGKLPEKADLKSARTVNCLGRPILLWAEWEMACRINIRANGTIYLGSAEFCHATGAMVDFTVSR